MAVCPILTFPDPRLRQMALPVTRFDAALAALAADLLDSLRAAPGIGITAPHLGILQRIVVLELDGPGSARIYVNPEIVWAAPETGRHAEGSISMPGVTEEIVRPVQVRVSYQDLAGNYHEEAADGLLAVCHQHEIDQLDGIFWIYRLSRLKRERLIKRYDKLRSL